MRKLFRNRTEKSSDRLVVGVEFVEASFDFQGEPFFVNNVKDDENENDENENDNNNDEEGDNNKIATLLEHLRQFQFLEEDDAKPLFHFIFAAPSVITDTQRYLQFTKQSQPPRNTN